MTILDLFGSIAMAFIGVVIGGPILYSIYRCVWVWRKQ